MSRVPTVRQADLDRAIRALKAAGLSVGRIVVRPGGEIEITPVPAAGESPASGTLTPEVAPAPPADLEDWRARKNGRRAAQGR